MKNIVTPRPFSLRAAIAGSILSVGMALAVAALIFFAWMADEVFEGDSLRIDYAVREYVHGYSTEWLTSLMQFFSFLGSTVFLTSATVLLIVVFLVRRQRYSAIVLAVVMIGGVILNYVLKISFGRNRPVPYFDTPLPDPFSFPSGHSLCSFCFYGIVAWLILPRVRQRPLKFAVWILAALTVISVGLSRIYLGVHFPTDVLAGYIAAFVWLCTVALADSARRTYFGTERA